MKKRKELFLIIEVSIIAFLGTAATYYSSEYSNLMNFAFKDFEYWVPLISTILTMVFCLGKLSTKVKKKENRK